MKKHFPGFAVALLVIGVAGTVVAGPRHIEINKLPSVHAWKILGAFGKPQLGVQLVHITPELREFYGSTAEVGVLVAKVLEDTPAQKAGIQVGDLIIEVDGEEVGTQSDVVRALMGKSDEEVPVLVLRNKRKSTLSAKIAKSEYEAASHTYRMLRQGHDFEEMMEKLEKLEDRIKDLEKR